MPAKKTTTKPKQSKLLEPPVLFDQTQKELIKLSKLVGYPVMSYFKPAIGNIWAQDLYALMEALKNIGKVKKLGLYIRSNGGQGMVSLRIINLLRSFADELILFAPSECASAATMLALGCDKVYMGPLSSLSPVDSSLTHVLSPSDKLNNRVPISLDELWRVLRLWKEAEKEDFNPENNISYDKNIGEDKEINFNDLQNPVSSKSKEKSLENPYKYLYEYIHPLVFGAVDRYSSLSVRICKQILSYHMSDQEKIDQITHTLNYDYPAHGYPITTREAREIGLPVEDLTSEMMDILNRLQLMYGELTEEKVTDYDNTTYHDNSIYSVIETDGLQLTYQQNYDKFYREAEKRYITLNDLSGWHKSTFETKTSSSAGKKTTKKTIKRERVFLA